MEFKQEAIGKLPKDEVEESWRKNYESGKIFWQLSKEQVEKIAKKIPDDSSILELGSREGIFLKQLSDENESFKLTGSDIVQESLVDGKKKVPKAEFIKVDVLKDEIPRKFDVIIAKLVLGCLREAGQTSPREELWDKALEKISGKCDIFIIINPRPKEDAEKETLKSIFVPEDVLQRLLKKYFDKSEQLESIAVKGDFYFDIYFCEQDKG